ncbi:MAG: hypothetical protein OXM57_05125 [bacterium]|nr:hypothetical protein [bacterium]MDE0352050.1 hypothetical protein [bacterium]
MYEKPSDEFKGWFASTMGLILGIVASVVVVVGGIILLITILSRIL